MSPSAGPADAAYTVCLDRIFEDFLSKRAVRAGRHDREVRDPDLLLDIVRAHGLLPPPARTVKVTGSKGKGTVARLAAAWLAAQPGAGPVGLFVSPNEVDQVDRIRIDGRPMPRADFVRLHDRFASDLARARAGLAGDRYLSPFGIFLLIALAWFRDNGVAWHVLECGRGAARDEVGRLPAEVAVVTSVFMEHATQIGPTLRDIAADKLTIADGTAATILGPDMPDLLDRLGLPMPTGAEVVVAQRRDPDLPGWYALDLDIATAAGRALLMRNDFTAAAVSVPAATASFGRLNLDGVPLIYDATIAFPAFDRQHFAALRARTDRLMVALSLSDQKDAAPFLAYFAGEGVDVVPIALSGLDLHTYERMLADRERPPAGTVGFTDAPALAALLRRVAAAQRPNIIYALGIQPFVRLLKQAIPARSGV